MIKEQVVENVGSAEIFEVVESKSTDTFEHLDQSVDLPVLCFIPFLDLSISFFKLELDCFGNVLILAGHQDFGVLLRVLEEILRRSEVQLFVKDPLYLTGEGDLSL